MSEFEGEVKVQSVDLASGLVDLVMDNRRLRFENQKLTEALNIADEYLNLVLMQRENFVEAAAENAIKWAYEGLEEIKKVMAQKLVR